MFKYAVLADFYGPQLPRGESILRFGVLTALDSFLAKIREISVYHYVNAHFPMMIQCRCSLEADFDEAVQLIKHNNLQSNNISYNNELGIIDFQIATVKDATLITNFLNAYIPCNDIVVPLTAEIKLMVEFVLAKNPLKTYQHLLPHYREDALQKKNHDKYYNVNFDHRKDNKQSLKTQLMSLLREGIDPKKITIRGGYIPLQFIKFIMDNPAMADLLWLFAAYARDDLLWFYFQDDGASQLFRTISQQEKHRVRYVNSEMLNIYKNIRQSRHKLYFEKYLNPLLALKVQWRDERPFIHFKFQQGQISWTLIPSEQLTGAELLALFAIFDEAFNHSAQLSTEQRFEYFKKEIGYPPYVEDQIESVINLWKNEHGKIIAFNHLNILKGAILNNMTAVKKNADTHYLMTLGSFVWGYITPNTQFHFYVALNFRSWQLIEKFISEPYLRLFNISNSQYEKYYPYILSKLYQEQDIAMCWNKVRSCALVPDELGVAQPPSKETVSSKLFAEFTNIDQPLLEKDISRNNPYALGVLLPVNEVNVANMQRQLDPIKLNVKGLISALKHLGVGQWMQSKKNQDGIASMPMRNTEQVLKPTFSLTESFFYKKQYREISVINSIRKSQIGGNNFFSKRQLILSEKNNQTNVTKKVARL
ncbi:MAG: hypothetical protein Tsb005_16090 [Gammaproteobacteria bacterium]